MSMEDFKKQGGALGGEKERTTHYSEGQPRSLNGHKVGEDCDTQDRIPESTVKDTGRNATNNGVGVDSRTTAANGSSTRTNGSEAGFNKHYGTDGAIAGYVSSIFAA